MPNPLPGMNPWLEHPTLWGDVHLRLIAALARDLSPRLGPRYYVSVGSQAYIATVFADPPTMRMPDVAIVRTHPILAASPPGQTSLGGATAAPILIEVPVPDSIEESFLEIREVLTGDVITVIEILSPTNKRPGPGRQKYERKRLEILSTHTHLVEIDLLRAWPPMPMIGDIAASDYRILVRRGEQGQRAMLYTFNWRDPVPVLPLPLQPDDSEPMIDLKKLIDEIYLEANYDLRLNYRLPPEPPLPEEELAWARELLKTR